MSTRYVKCPRCEGAGGMLTEYVETEDGSMIINRDTRPCPVCNGKGRASLFEPLGDGLSRSSALPSVDDVVGLMRVGVRR